jgi:ketosteroid isomerase-like protein
MTMVGGVAHQIEQRNKLFEADFNGGNFAALATAYTEHATVMPPDAEPVHGRPAIQQFWQTVKNSGVESIALHTTSVDAHGDMAVRNRQR